MENEILQSTASSPLFDEYTKEKIVGAAKLAVIASLLSIIGSVVGLITFFINPNPVSKVAAKEGFDEKMAQFQTSGTVISVILSLAFNLILFYFLYRFSTLTRKSIAENNQQQLSNGLYSLGTYFKIWVVLIIISILLMIVAVIAAGLGAAMG